MTLSLIVAVRIYGEPRFVASLTEQISYPLYKITSIPGKWLEGFSSYFASRDQLIEENERLHAEAIVLRGKTQRLVALTAENVRLKELLSSSTVLEEKVAVAEVISVSPNPETHTLTVDRGTRDGVYVGQAVIDAYGLVGQVATVYEHSAKVILISDARHALPVMVNRNGVRAIAEGSGRLNRLNLRYVVETADVQAGDLLVSSGLGQKFPVGYPVGVVESVESRASSDFSSIIVRPSAKLDRGRYVLLVQATGL